MALLDLIQQRTEIILFSNYVWWGVISAISQGVEIGILSISTIVSENIWLKRQVIALKILAIFGELIFLHRFIQVKDYALIFIVFLQLFSNGRQLFDFMNSAQQT